MFENLTEKLTRAFKNLSGQGRLTEDNIKQALREVRISLLEADVALSVVEQFNKDIKEKAKGVEVSTKLSPREAFIKLVNDELVTLMGEEHSELNFNKEPPVVFLLAGLQGSGKTTTAAKLAKFLKEQKKKKVMLASCDTYRPAAIEQLSLLAKDLDVNFFETSPTEKPENIAKNALKHAKKQYIDVLIIDTAGRLHIDNVMMDEIKAIHKITDPLETLFVIDSMTGQDAANTAKAFNEALPLTGVILTKTDGDARGGSALSVRYVTGKPIKFIGTGEKIDALEPFHPERIASRILGMGDILTLVEEIERKTDKASGEKFAKKIKKGKSFDFEDFREQLLQMNKMGGIAGMISKLPGLGQLPNEAQSQFNDKSLGQTIAIINSMTPKERRVPKIIIGSRKKRIALGSGTTIQDVNRLLKQFNQMQKVMKKFTKPGAMEQMMQKMGGMSGIKNMLGKNMFPNKFN